MFVKQQLCRDGAVGRGRIVALQISFMFVGMLAVSAAIALARDLMTGTSPISCIPAVLVDWLQATGYRFCYFRVPDIACHLCLVGEILLLRRNFSVVQLLQMPAIFVLFLSIDCWVWCSRLSRCHFNSASCHSTFYPSNVFWRYIRQDRRRM